MRSSLKVLRKHGVFWRAAKQREALFLSAFPGSHDFRVLQRQNISSTAVAMHLGHHHDPDSGPLPPREGHQRGVALVVGAGDALGSALAHKFAKKGLIACVVRRDAAKLYELKRQIEAKNYNQYGHDHYEPDNYRCETFPADARREDQMEQVVESVESSIGPIQLAVHNIGANVRFGLLDKEMTANKYFKVWEMAALSAFNMGKAVVSKMQSRGEGTILFTGATASLRGSSHFSAFAGAMFAKRALAQSMAREFGPQGIHVAHVIIDGGIKTEFVRKIIGEEKYQGALKKEALLLPEAIAENYWNLHQQPRVAWTHELDLRPWVEKW
jgi:NAD(P)-dependent dehydrogenase (short-subunit alcohol dehydrogenase family)